MPLGVYHLQTLSLMPKRNNVAFQEIHLLLVSAASLYHPARKQAKKKNYLDKTKKYLDNIYNLIQFTVLLMCTYFYLGNRYAKEWISVYDFELS